MSAQVQAQVKPSSPPAPAVTPVYPGLLQRKCACGSSTALTDTCAACRSERLTLQRRSADRIGQDTVPPSVHDVLHAPGQPLDAVTRNFFEPHFGHDFSRVRVHTDARAAASARAVDALAYTVGRHVVFDAGRYMPHTRAGRQLLAHELTHVVQQGDRDDSPADSDIELGASGDVFEQQAHTHEASVVADLPAASRPPSMVGAPRLQRATVGSFLSELFSLSPGPFSAIYRAFGGENYSQQELQDYLDRLATTGKIEDRYDSDNKARAIVKRRAEFKPLETATKILLIQEMLNGATLGADEKAILELLRTASPGERTTIVQKVGRELLWGNFSGANRRALEAMTLTEADFSDPNLIERLKALSTAQLTEYRDNALDPAVRANIEKLLKMQKITTPLPIKAEFDESGVARLEIHGADVIVRPDVISTDANMGKRAHTQVVTQAGSIDNIMASGDGKIASFTAHKTTFTIQTTYGPEAVPTGPAGYGRGTTSADVLAGTTSLKFHESRHGQDFMDFLNSNPPPKFTGSVGMSVEDFTKAMDDYGAATTAYAHQITLFSIKKSDCPGTPIPASGLAELGLAATFCTEQAGP